MEPTPRTPHRHQLMETATANSSRRELGSLYEPRSVAIVGASADPMKWGHLMARDALLGAGRRRVYLVNAKGGEILGQTAHRSAAELPEPPELVVLTVPESRFEEAVADALGAGARALVAITAGLAEGGEEGRARERAVVERVQRGRRGDARPQLRGRCGHRRRARSGLGAPTAGPIGLISQSGNVALELARLAADIGLGFTRVASIGNQADLEVADLVTDLGRHEATKVIALYVEDFRHGRALAEAILEAGKPVIVLAAGASEAGARAATSHTGALVSDLAVVDAACREAGAVRVSSPAELIDVAQALLHGNRAAGPRVAIVSDGGGHGVIAADLATAAGLELPTLSDGLRRRILDWLPGRPVPRTRSTSPAQATRTSHSYERVVERDRKRQRGRRGRPHRLFRWLQRRGRRSRRRRARVRGRAADGGGRGAAAAPAPGPHDVLGLRPAMALRDAGVPVYAGSTTRPRRWARIVSTPPLGGRASFAAPAADPRCGARATGPRVRRSPARGFRWPSARRVRDREEALAAAAEIGYPVALKATGELHKSDAGGVALGLAGECSPRPRLRGHVRLGGDSYAVERMAPLADGVELLVGARRDPRFGPVVAVGIGGLYAEVLDDVAVGLAPVARGRRIGCCARCVGAPLLGARGRAPLDLAAAAGCGGPLGPRRRPPRARRDRGQPPAGPGGGCSGSTRGSSVPPAGIHRDKNATKPRTKEHEMDFTLTDRQQELRERAAALATEIIAFEDPCEHERGLRPRVAGRDPRLTLEHELNAINMPTEWGGQGLSLLEQVIVQERLGQLTNALWDAVWRPANALRHCNDRAARALPDPGHRRSSAATASRSPRRTPARTRL